MVYQTQQKDDHQAEVYRRLARSVSRTQMHETYASKRAVTRSMIKRRVAQLTDAKKEWLRNVYGSKVSEAFLLTDNVSRSVYTRGPDPGAMNWTISQERRDWLRAAYERAVSKGLKNEPKEDNGHNLGADAANDSTDTAPSDDDSDMSGDDTGAKRVDWNEIFTSSDEDVAPGTDSLTPNIDSEKTDNWAKENPSTENPKEDPFDELQRLLDEASSDTDVDTDSASDDSCDDEVSRDAEGANNCDPTEELLGAMKAVMRKFLGKYDFDFNHAGRPVTLSDDDVSFICRENTPEEALMAIVRRFSDNFKFMIDRNGEPMTTPDNDVIDDNSNNDIKDEPAIDYIPDDLNEVNVFDASDNSWCKICGKLRAECDESGTEADCDDDDEDYVYDSEECEITGYLNPPKRLKVGNGFRYSPVLKESANGTVSGIDQVYVKDNGFELN